MQLKDDALQVPYKGGRAAGDEWGNVSCSLNRQSPG